MIDAVLSYHMNPATCGVSKFNVLLAQKLGVPHGSIYSTGFSSPLLSLKFHELRSIVFPNLLRYSLFVHDIPAYGYDWELVGGAQAVYAANSVIADAIRVHRDDVVTAFCPSTLQGNPTRGAFVRVLLFGMAHKVNTERLKWLKRNLDAMRREYTVSVSTAVHEGSPWESVATVGEQVRAIFGERTRLLGFLADDALARELEECTHVALFYEPALRANNTTYWAAVEAGKPIFTNRDEHSPQPSDHQSYSWDALLQTMGASVSV
jgi:hypothetical protein